MISHSSDRELLLALLELKVIKREGIALMFDIEECLGELGKINNQLELEEMDQDNIAGRLRKLWSNLFRSVYELQDVLQRGD